MDVPLMDPNLNADIYRNMTPADRAPVPDTNLQFIATNDEKRVLLGGGNMTDRYWSGTVWYFDQSQDFDRNKALVATKAESGICDGAFFDLDKFLIAEDSGVLQVLCLIELADTHLTELQCLGYACQHDDTLISLSVFSNNSHVVTGGLDCCIKVWDIAEMIATRSFNYAHTDVITCVDAEPKGDNIFVSSSFDGEALMWDIRQSKPAESIRKANMALTSVKWNPVSDYIVAVGSEDGSISLLDIRKPGIRVLQERRVFPRGVHRLAFNSERSEELAGCCDDTVVKVFDVSTDLSLIYENDDHSDFVRGLSWCKNELLTCSWDNTVIKHLVHNSLESS